MLLEEFLINKINAGEPLTKMEKDIFGEIKKIRNKYQQNCKFLGSVDISQYDGHTVKDCDMVTDYTFRTNQNSSFEQDYPEIVLKKNN